MTELWHCPPSIFEQQTEEQIELHARIYEAKIKAERIAEKRLNQRNGK
jgi:hypothetical protein